MEDSEEFILNLREPKKLILFKEYLKKGNDKAVSLILKEFKRITFHMFEYEIFDAIEKKHIKVLEVLRQHFASKENRGEEFLCMCGYVKDVQEISTFYNKYKIFLDEKEALYSACIGDNLEAAKFLVEEAGVDEIEYAMNGACEAGSKRMAQYLVGKGAEELGGYMFELACKSGNEELIEYLITEGKLGVDDFCNGFYGAMRNGSKQLVDKFVKLGASDFDYGLDEACQKGDFEFAKYFVDLGAIEFNRGLSGAARSGNKQLVDYLIEKGADKWQYGMMGACEQKDKSLVDFFLEKKADPNDGIFGASQSKNLEMLQYLSSKGAKRFNNGYKFATRNAELEIMKFLVEKGNKKFGRAVFDACNVSDFEMLNFLLSKGAQIEKDSLHSVAKLGNTEILDFLVSKGANNFDSLLEDICNERNHDLFEYVISKYSSRYNSKNTLNALKASLNHNNAQLTFLVLFHFKTEIPPRRPPKTNDQEEEGDNQDQEEQEIAEEDEDIFEKYEDSKRCLAIVEDFLNGQLFKFERLSLCPVSFRQCLFQVLLSLKVFSNNKLKKKIPKPLVSMIVELFANSS